MSSDNKIMAKKGKVTAEIWENCKIHSKIMASTVKSQYRREASMFNI